MIFPFSYPLLKEIFSGQNYMYPNIGNLIRVQVLGINVSKTIFFLPSILGYIPLTLGLYAILKVKRFETKFFCVIGIIFFILSLGPFFSLFEKTFYRFSLFSFILSKLPILKAIRAFHKFLFMVMVAIAVLVAFACKKIRNNFENIKSLQGNLLSYFMITLITFIIFAEYKSPFITYPQPSISKFYIFLARETGDFSIMELPLHIPGTAEQRIEGEYMYYQTIHKKKLINGYISRTPTSVKSFFRKNLFTYLLANPKNIQSIELTPQKQMEFIYFIKHYRIKYIILHKNYVVQKHPFLQTKREIYFLPFGISNFPHKFTNNVFDSLDKRGFYTFGEMKLVKKLLQEIFKKPYYEDKDIIVYSLNTIKDL